MTETTITKSYSLSAVIDFEYDSEKVDPFWFIEDGQKKWRMEGIYPSITTEDDIWEHLAFNALVNSVDDASRLDGWGDLSEGELTMTVKRDRLFLEEA